MTNFNLISILSTLLLICFDFTSKTTETGLLALDEIEITSIPTLKKILEDVISEKEKQDSQFYIIYIYKYNSLPKAFKVLVEKTDHYVIENDDYTGYFTVDADTIVVRTQKGIKFQKKPNGNQVKIHVYENIPMTYDPPTWEYVINDNDAARYIQNIGWVWFTPLHSILNDKNKYRLTKPCRTKNPQ